MLSGALRLALQLYGTSPSVTHHKTKQGIGFMGKDHSPNLVCMSWAVAAHSSYLGMTQGDRDKALTWQVQHLADVPHGCPVWMHCHALQMSVWWRGSSASKISFVLPVPAIFCVCNSFIKMLLTYVLGKIPQQRPGCMTSNKTLRREGFKRAHCQLGESF